MLKQTPKSAGPAPRGSVALEADMAQPVEPVSTADVTEQFDWNKSKSPLILKLRKSPQENAKSIEKTLENLVKRFA